MFFHGFLCARFSRGPRHGKETFRGTECQGGGLPQHGLCRWNRTIQADEQVKTT